jgi:hypothetical protein
MKTLLVGIIAILPLAAQEIKLPASIDKLAERASNVVDVNMDGQMLQLASKFLSDKDPDEAAIKRLVGGIKSITVKSFEFDGRHDYDQKDADDLRSVFTGPGWSRIVSVKSKRDGGNADVYLRSDGDKLTGVGIVVADPRELTFVSVNGPIKPEDVADLPGHFGIPRIELGRAAVQIGGSGKDKDKDKNKDKDKDKEKDKGDREEDIP